MGKYINIGNAGFRSSRNGEYVDKSALVAAVNNTLFSERQFSCVSRCRRFGKSMAAKMLYAYYDHSCDSRSLFADLEIAHDPSFEKHLNKYAAIYLDMTDFVSQYKTDDIVDKIDAALLEDVSKAYPDVPVVQGDWLMDYLLRVSIEKEERFVFIIDEWDAIFRSGGFAIRPPEYKDLQSAKPVQSVSSHRRCLYSQRAEYKPLEQATPSSSGFDSPAGYKRKK